MKTEYMFCYDRDLQQFLRYKKGFMFITKAKHLTTNKVFYLFLKSEDLDKALIQWNSVRQSNEE